MKMKRQNLHFGFLNMGHLLDHLFMLIFATVAALALATDWQMTYADLIPYAMPGFVAFGICAIPAGWIADKWHRHGMVSIFFIGIGVASTATSFANSPLQIGCGLFAIGLFAAIYHPVGIAMVVEGRVKTGMPLALNGVFGNIGVAAAALVTGIIIDTFGWRAAFLVPGVISVAIGFSYVIFTRAGDLESLYPNEISSDATRTSKVEIDRAILVQVFSIIFFTTAMGGLIFQSTTFSLPKILDERLNDFATNATEVGAWAFIVFTVAAFAQLVVGYLVDRHSVKLVFSIIAGCQVVLFALMMNLDGAAAIIVSIGFMLMVFGQIPINDVLIGRVAKSEWRSRAFAIRSFITFTVMATSIPLIAWL
ncbi:MAG TPA: MFS transporter, partial [Rhodospirillales bacterium]|nr:MFS transporter [Rhodospirillales bacterium]